jgi:sortase A
MDESFAPPLQSALPQESPEKPTARQGAIKQSNGNPSPTAAFQPEKPLRIVIPAIQLDAPVAPAESSFVRFMGQDFQQWQAPDKFAAGWHMDSAMLGETGNTVLNGHNNIYGEVFAHLEELNPGDIIQVYGDAHIFNYRVANVMILPEKYENLDIRSQNAQWILPSKDERLTLVSCWPYNSNTHRMIIVASPLSREEITKSFR